MEGKCLSEAVLLSEPEQSDSLCLFEDGGGGRRGTWGSGLDSGGAGCASGFALLEVTFAPSSKSRESSCTTTSATSASFVSSATCGASSHADPVPEGSGEGDTEEKLPSFCSLSSFSSIFLSSLPSCLTELSSSSSSSLSSESPKPSCARALAIFLR